MLDSSALRTRDAALRTLIPDWSWKSLPSPPAQPLPQTYRGTWRGRVHDGESEIPVVLSIAEPASSLQIGRQAPEPISQLGLVEGVLVGTTRGKLEFPAARAAQAEALSLRLQLRGAKLAGEIGTEVPIARAAVPGHLPFWAELARVQP